MNSVSALNLVVTKSGYPAVADSSFELPKRACTLVTGPNGSGKTTLLKAISGILEPQRGEISIGEDGVSSRAPRMLRRYITYVGHTPLYMRHINVRNHLELCVRLNQRFENDDFVLGIDEVLELFGLANRSLVEVANLSAGQQRRLHFASALVRSTPTLCLDEPHSSLDSASKDLIDSVIKGQFEHGRNFLVATHDPQRLRKIATHEIEVHSGCTKLKELK